ncbi:PP2C family protein-serine/threonine phosphatase [Nocardioides aurantiacus]|uniref:Stage II sporulation protein E n=1 Tax=Nocardioides aurantiacus TaxID=86796 RepID=A0A3N2CWT1_9ACTN|nr:PP2C family protein-serine/threonine phosphatase [Nocardioides aurantiacus]ROR91674.1 stage II sporulation protein E [Nocardioides aurantiacus]
MSLLESLSLPDARRRLRASFSASDTPALVVLVVLTVGIVVAGLVAYEWVPTTTLVLPLIIGSLWLGPRTLPWFTVLVCLGVCVMLLAPEVNLNARSAVRTGTIFAVATIILFTSFRRSRLGVSGPRGESMFVDLRDRISRQGVLPELPDRWSVEAVVRSAGGTQFAGDFVVARRSVDDRLDVVLVDVSGKGVEAGSRSLFLSGAFNGIVSALPGEEFLPAANTYLMGQDWDEGFATAVHLHLDLATGDFELRKAGHPPAVWLHAGSGRWTVVASDGPVLGLIADADFECVRGRLAAGDGLMLFTDGLVETATRDISLGIDKLAGLGEGMLQRGFDGAAERTVSAITHTNDDRALIVVHRRW